MERLTERTTDGSGGYKIQAKNLNSHCVAKDKRGYITYYGQHIDKLAEYEDAEEQGLLLKLPCKVGDIIYVIPSITNYRLMKLNGHPENNKVYEQIVHSVQMFSNCRYSLITCEGCASVVSDLYKETWFLTKEEAEQKLKEMEV